MILKVVGGEDAQSAGDFANIQSGPSFTQLASVTVNEIKTAASTVEKGVEDIAVKVHKEMHKDLRHVGHDLKKKVLKVGKAVGTGIEYVEEGVVKGVGYVEEGVVKSVEYVEEGVEKGVKSVQLAGKKAKNVAVKLEKEMHKDLRHVGHDLKKKVQKVGQGGKD
jgi:BMFP domain-containing protein YqiC